MMNISITSLGALTSIGAGVVMSCAAHRAGIVRPRPLENFALADIGEEPEGVVGHPIHPFTNGFYLFGLWVRLATECMSDLLHYGRLPSRARAGFWEGTALIVAAPLLSSGRLPLPDDDVEQMLKEYYLLPMLELLDLPMRQENLYVEESGHCSAAQAITRAEYLLAGGRVDRVIVLGVDSYTDRFSLEWLMEANALKTRTNPVGAMPGEAGACFMLESERSLRNRAAVAEGVVGVPVVSLGTNAEPRDVSDIGRRLAEVLRAVSLASGGPQPEDLYLDLNGEEWRARAWGVAQVCLRHPVVLGNYREIVPCASFGETGAASGALAVCLAVRSRVRKYARGLRSIICSMNERGDVSAFPVLSSAK